MGEARTRVLSLDALRGFVVAAMLVVNNPGRPELAPYQLGHAPWGQGITFADLVMPWFLFVIGVSLPFAIEPGRGKPGLWRKAVTRCLVLLGLGILLVSSANRRLVIGLDVLQHLGLAGLFATLVYVRAGHARWLVSIGILVAHWALLRFSGPLGEHDNVIARFNREHLAPFHLAGLVSPVATTALVLFGTHAGQWLRDQDLAIGARSRRMLLAGSVAAGAGWIWHYDLFFSKALWSAPYLLFAGGLGMILLALAHLLVEGCGFRTLAFPFTVFGRNAILAYFGAIIVKHHTVDEWRTTSRTGIETSMRDAIVAHYVEVFGGPWGSFTWTLTWLLFVWLACLWLYRRGIFWKL